MYERDLENSSSFISFTLSLHQSINIFSFLKCFNVQLKLEHSLSPSYEELAFNLKSTKEAVPVSPALNKYGIQQFKSYGVIFRTTKELAPQL